MEEWRTYQLSEVINKFIDYRGKTPRKTVAGIPLITAKIVKGGCIAEPTEFIAEEDYDSWMTRGLPQKGDVVLTTEAPLGEVAQIRTEAKVALAQRIITLRGKKNVLDNAFLRYALQSSVMQHRLHARASGSTVQGIKSSELKQVVIDLPSYPVQCRIGYILSAFDDKIECNRRINQMLEAMAQTLYKHWFVDFGSFKSSELQDTELEEIPSGWEVVPFSHFVSISSQTVNPQLFPSELFSHFSIPAYDEGKVPSIEEGKSVLSGKTIIDSDRVLVSKLNPRIYRAWTVYKPSERRAFSSTEFINYIPNHEDFWAFVNCHVRDEVFIREFCSHATGTTGSRQRVPPQRTLSFQCVKPSDEALREFNKICEPYFRHIDSNIKENQTLSRTRDYLLPKLLSGEIEVKAAEQAVEAVT
jgi:type I restriction enzyme, S subunit